MQFPNIDPVLIDVPSFKLAGMDIDLELRLYGVAYALLFAFGYFSMRWLARRNYLRMTPEDVVSYVLWCVVGTFIGGRLGEMIFYQGEYFLSDATLGQKFETLVSTWKGGMSFHGGLIGVSTAVFLYARKKKQSFWNFHDACGVTVPFGIFLVRLATWLQGDLIGRQLLDAQGRPITDGAQLPWYATKFPTDPVAINELTLRGESIVKGNPLPVDPAIWAQVEPLVPGRYPSALVATLGEGLLLWVVMLLVWRNVRRPGVTACLFVAFYGIIRICTEFVREPDPSRAFMLEQYGISMGQLLSSGMVLGGLAGAALFNWYWRLGPDYPDSARRWPWHRVGKNEPEATNEPKQPAAETRPPQA